MTPSRSPAASPPPQGAPPAPIAAPLSYYHPPPPPPPSAYYNYEQSAYAPAPPYYNPHAHAYPLMYDHAQPPPPPPPAPPHTYPLHSTPPHQHPHYGPHAHPQQQPHDPHAHAQYYPYAPAGPLPGYAPAPVPQARYYPRGHFVGGRGGSHATNGGGARIPGSIVGNEGGVNGFGGGRVGGNVNRGGGGAGRGGGRVLREEDVGGSAGKVLENEARGILEGCSAGRQQGVEAWGRVQEMLEGWVASIRAGGLGMFGESEAVEIVVEWFIKEGAKEGQGKGGEVAGGDGQVKKKARAALVGVMTEVFWGDEEVMEGLLKSGGMVKQEEAAVVRRILEMLKNLKVEIAAYAEPNDISGGSTPEARFRVASAALNSVFGQIVALDAIYTQKDLADRSKARNGGQNKGQRLASGATGAAGADCYMDALVQLILARVSTAKTSLGADVPDLWRKLIAAAKSVAAELAEALKSTFKELKLTLDRLESHMGRIGLRFGPASAVSARQYPALLQVVDKIKRLITQHCAAIDMSEKAQERVTAVLSAVANLGEVAQRHGVALSAAEGNTNGLVAVVELVRELCSAIDKWGDETFASVCNKVVETLSRSTSGRRLKFCVEEGSGETRKPRHTRTKSSPDELLHRQEDFEDDVSDEEDEAVGKTMPGKGEEGKSAGLACVDEEKVSISPNDEKLAQLSLNGDSCIANGENRTAKDGEVNAQANSEGPESGRCSSQNKEEKKALENGTDACAEVDLVRRRPDRGERAGPSPSRNTPVRAKRLSHSRTMSVDAMIM